MQKLYFITSLLLFAAFAANAQTKKQSAKGNWQAVGNLSVGTPIAAKSPHSIQLLCHFGRATDQKLFCQPPQPTFSVPAPWPNPAPFPYPVPPRPAEHVFKRQKIQEVRLEHSEASNQLIGSGIGAAAGAGLGAVAFRPREGRAALIFVAMGSLIGGGIGRTIPLFHLRIIYKR